MGRDSGQTNNRRRFLAALGTAAIGSLAGCSGDNSSDSTGDGGEDSVNGGENGVPENGNKNGQENTSNPAENGTPQNGGSNETEPPTDNGGENGINETEPGNGNGQDEGGENGGDDLGEMLNQLETESHNVLEQSLNAVNDDRARIRLVNQLEYLANMIEVDYEIYRNEIINGEVGEEYKSEIRQSNSTVILFDNLKKPPKDIRDSSEIYPPKTHELLDGQWTGKSFGSYGFVRTDPSLLVASPQRSLLEDYVDLYDGEVESLLDSMEFEGLDLEGVVTSFSVNRPDQGSIIPEVDMTGLLEGYGGDYERFVNYFYVDPDNPEKLLEDGEIWEVTKGYKDGEWEIIDDYSRGFDAEFYFDELN
jgi:hypothetical protein